MMLRQNLRTDVQICGKSTTQASLFVRHGRGVNRVYYMRPWIIITVRIKSNIQIKLMLLL